MPTFTCGGMFVQEKTSWQLVWKNTFSFSLLTKSIKISQKVNILFYYWKTFGPGFQIQRYLYVKKFQTASKNTVSPSKASFPYNCKSSSGEELNNPKSQSFCMSCCSLVFFFKLAKDTINNNNNNKVAFNYNGIKEIFHFVWLFSFWHHSWLQYHPQLETPRRVRTTRAIKCVTTRGEGKKCWKWRLFKDSIGNCAAQWVQNMFFLLLPPSSWHTHTFYGLKANAKGCVLSGL